MNDPRVSLKLVALTALVALSAGPGSGRAALSSQGGGNANNGEEFIFGTVGITASQTARLNVVNTATDGPAQTRVLKFLNAAGNVIVTKTVTLAPGESDYLDIDGAAIAGSGRIQIRALDLAADYVLAEGQTRAEIRPVVRPEGPPQRIISTLRPVANHLTRSLLKGELSCLHLEMRSRPSCV